MLKSILTAVLGSLVLASAANAETVRLATTTMIDPQSRELIIDIKDTCGLKAVSVAAKGVTLWLNEVVVAYRAPQVTRDRFVVNRVLNNSSSNWLQLRKTDLCVRRFYLNVEASGSFVVNPTITVYGLK